MIAAGKMWLYSSVDFVRRRENWTREALVGAITLTPRERMITAAIESKPNPAVESNDRIAEILNKGHVRLSFVMSPKLVDFYLEDVSYRDQFLGVNMDYRGSLRFAIFDGVVLLRTTQMVTGHFDRTFQEGPGGFSGGGDVAVLVEFGGLISERGMAAYGLISVSISLRVQAWIRIEFSFTIGCGPWKKRISFSKTFKLPRGQIELGLRRGCVQRVGAVRLRRPVVHQRPDLRISAEHRAVGSLQRRRDCGSSRPGRQLRTTHRGLSSGVTWRRSPCHTVGISGVRQLEALAPVRIARLDVLNPARRRPRSMADADDRANGDARRPAGAGLRRTRQTDRHQRPWFRRHLASPAATLHTLGYVAYIL